MKKLASLAAMSVSALAISVSAASAEYTLNILHINDLHSRIESINRFDSTCSADDETEGKCFGGIARVKTKVDERRNAIIREGGNVLFLNAGDQFQGSLFYTTYKGEADVQFLNKMGVDAMAVGNHEFDDGPEVLAKYVDAAQFPVISGNLLVAENSPLGDRVPPYLIKEIVGEKIGILSVLATDTDETSSPGPTVLLMDEVRTLNAQVAELQEMGINKIILLSHVGLNRDKEIAAAVDGIDVIVGGHSHTLLSNTDEDAAGPYPTMVQNPSGQDVPIVQAYAYSKYLGELAVTFDDEGNVISAEGEPHLLDASVEPNAGFLAMVEEFAAPIEELKAKVVGSTSDTINGAREDCRARECQMGNLVADAMLDRVAGQGVQIAIQNGGGLRASIDGGEVTMGEVLTVLPFQNTLATFDIKGSEVLAALENGVSQIEDGAGRFPQVAGMTYSFDKDAEPGSRIVEVLVGGAPLDPEATYSAVSNNYMRGGGDGYSAFTTAANAYDFGPGLEQVVADYIAANSPYTPFLDGRITAASAVMEKPAEEASVDVPQTSLGADALASTGPSIGAAEPAVAVPETSLGADALATAGPSIEAAPAGRPDHIVVAGDTYWDLAKKFYGDAEMWPKLQDANPDFAATALEIGTSLTIPE